MGVFLLCVMVMLKLPFCLFAHPKVTSATNHANEKAKSVCFIGMQQQTVKFTLVQINKKHVS